MKMTNLTVLCWHFTLLMIQHKVWDETHCSYQTLTLSNPNHNPEKDQKSLLSISVLALYLHGEWWCVDDVLRTSNKCRSGLVMVIAHFVHLFVF